MDIRPRQMRQWIDQLPKANISELGRQVFHALDDINRTEHSTEDRLHALETLRPLVAYLLDSLEQHVLDASLPLPPKKQQIGKLCCQMENLFATGYKVLVEELVSSPARPTPDHELVVALQRSVRHLARVLFYSAMTYARPPGGVWRELHRLYLYAEKQRLVGQTVADNYQWKVSETTIGACYKQAILLSCAAPQSLRQRQIVLADVILSEYGEHAELHVPIEQSVSAQFIANLWSDGAPMPIHLYGEPLTNLCRFVQTDVMIDKIRNSFGQGNLSETITSLLRQLGAPAKREHDRESVKQTLSLIASFNVIHNHIDNSRHTEEDLFEHLTLDSTERSPNDPWGATGRDPEVQATPDFRFGVTADPIAPADTIEYTQPGKSNGSLLPGSSETNLCQTINASDGGYCLVTRANKPVKLKVGELVGLGSDLEKGAVSIAVVRWIQQWPKQQTGFGVELLARNADAGHLTLTDDPEQSYRCLLLPQWQESEQPASLLIATESLEEGVEATLHRGEEEIEVRLTRKIQTSLGFAQFGYAELKSGSDENAGPEDGPDDQIDIDEAWAMLD